MVGAGERRNLPRDWTERQSGRALRCRQAPAREAQTIPSPPATEPSAADAKRNIGYCTPGWHAVTGRCPASQHSNRGFTPEDPAVPLRHGSLTMVRIVKSPRPTPAVLPDPGARSLDPPQLTCTTCYCRPAHAMLLPAARPSVQSMRPPAERCGAIRNFGSTKFSVLRPNFSGPNRCRSGAMPRSVMIAAAAAQSTRSLLPQFCGRRQGPLCVSHVKESESVPWPPPIKTPASTWMSTPNR